MLNMDEDERTVLTDTSQRQAGNKMPQPEGRSSESYYKEMARHHAGFSSNYLTPPDSLETLYNRTCCLSNLFQALNRPWVSGSEEIQKACAWYLSQAGLSGNRRDTFIRVLGDIAHSVCYLSACGDFIAQMQRYYRHQEKELRLLLDEKKEIERRQQKSAKRLSTESSAYCITIGQEEIYGVIYPQLEELYRVMGLFIEREKAPFQCNVESYDEYEIGISKDVNLCADRDDYFFTDYSLSTSNGISYYDFSCVSKQSNGSGDDKYHL